MNYPAKQSKRTRLSVKDEANALFDLAYGRANPLLYSRETAARLLSISERTLDRIVADGEISYNTVRGRIMLSQGSLDSYVKRTTVRP